MNCVLKNLDDGRLLLQFEGKHMWLNTPNYSKTFHGESVSEVLEDYTHWLMSNLQRLDWIEDRKMEIKETKDEGVIIDLTNG